jgi:4'-phosphopantetheinyl transferase EntD
MIAEPLLEALVEMLPTDVACAGGTFDVSGDELFAVELRAVERAVAKRRREFRAGRIYARRALAALACPPQPLPVGPSRQVIWPPGFLGSISHSDEVCAAIVARCADYCGAGIDLESDRPLDDDGMRALIFRPEERSIAWSEGDPAKLLFVIKEAVYKAYHPQTNCFLEFSDLSVQIDAAEQSFHAELMRSDAPPLAGRRSFAGNFRRCEQHLVAILLVPRR